MILRALPFLILTALLSNAFQRRHSAVAGAGRTRIAISSLSKLEALSTSETTNNKNGISLVTVCMGELCRCQEGEGVSGAEAIYKELTECTSNNGVDTEEPLPYPIETSICLGACGLDPVVTIDYDDGTSFLAYGYQETLQELGIVRDFTEVTPTTTTANTDKEPIAMFRGKRVDAKELWASNRENRDTRDPVVRRGENSQPQPEKEGIEITSSDTELQAKPSKLQDARERMRASNDSNKVNNSGKNQINPWAQAAFYLTQKAQNKLFGSP